MSTERQKKFSVHKNGKSKQIDQLMSNFRWKKVAKREILT